MVLMKETVMLEDLAAIFEFFSQMVVPDTVLLAVSQCYSWNYTKQQMYKVCSKESKKDPTIIQHATLVPGLNSSTKLN